MKVFLIAALTVDGFIARNQTDVSTRWTSKEDAAWFLKKTQEAGVVIMGHTTYRTIGKPLSKRVNIILTRDTDNLNDQDHILGEDQELNAGQTYFTNKNPQQILRLLEKHRYESVAIAGGASIYTLFMKAQLIDTLYLTIEPVVFGDGIRLFNQELHLKEQPRVLKLHKVRQLSQQTMMLEYVLKSHE